MGKPFGRQHRTTSDSDNKRNYENTLPNINNSPANLDSKTHSKNHRKRGDRAMADKGSGGEEKGGEKHHRHSTEKMEHTHTHKNAKFPLSA